MREPLEAHIREYLPIRVGYLDDRPSKEKIIRPIPDNELDAYKSLGRASAQSIGFALHMAHNHQENFYERVAGYRLFKSQEAVMMEEAFDAPYGSIEFYELIESVDIDETDIQAWDASCS